MALMTGSLRRGMFWLTLSLNVVAAVGNLVAAAVLAWRGQRAWPDLLLAILCGAIAYANAVIDDVATARLAILACHRRSAEAQAAMHDDMLAKLKAASVTVDVSRDDPAEDYSRRH